MELEIALSEKGSAQRLKLENELNEALLQQTTKRLETQQELEQKAFDSRKAAQQGIVDLFVNSENKRIDKIKDVQFINYSYDMLEIPESSIIYCDIPYKNTTALLFIFLS